MRGLCKMFQGLTWMSEITRPAMYMIWIVVIVWGWIKNDYKIIVSAFAQRFIISFVAFASFCLIAGQFNELYFSANYLSILVTPLLVTIAGDMYGNMDEALMGRLAKLYLICSVIFAVWVQITYFSSYSSWLLSESYIYHQKNSAGQIWASAIFIALFFIKYENQFQKYMSYVACFFMFVMIALCQCRTALSGLVVATMAYILLISKHRIRLIFLFLLIIIAVRFIPFTRRFIEQALFLTKYAGTDLNTFSSGRFGLYEKAFSYIVTSPFIGVGKYYVDCSYISIVAETGLVGLCLIELVWIKKIILCFRYRGGSLLFFMLVFYLVESLAEAFPPFGPGVSSFMFWFLSEILCEKEGRLKKVMANESKSAEVL